MGNPGQTWPWASELLPLVGSTLFHLALLWAVSHWVGAPTREAGNASQSAGISITLVDGDEFAGARRLHAPAAEQHAAAAAGTAVPLEQTVQPALASTGAAPASRSGAVVEASGTAGVPSATTPAPSAGGAPAGVSAAAYLRALTEHIRGFRRYPALPAKVRPEGLVRLGIVVARNGEVKQLWTVASSGNGALDNAAMETVWRAAPLPAIPSYLPDELELTVPIDFERPR